MTNALDTSRREKARAEFIQELSDAIRTIKFAAIRAGEAGLSKNEIDDAIADVLPSFPAVGFAMNAYLRDGGRALQ
jgi:hypothetical protein